MKVVEIPPDKYPIGAYRKVQLGAVSDLIAGIMFSIMFIFLVAVTGLIVVWLFFLIMGIWFIFTALMLRKACKLIMNEDYYLVRKGGKIAIIFGILGLSWFAVIGGLEAMEWKVTRTYQVEEYEPPFLYYPP